MIDMLSFKRWSAQRWHVQRLKLASWQAG